jgi:hypothetical protein
MTLLSSPPQPIESEEFQVLFKEARRRRRRRRWMLSGISLAVAATALALVLASSKGSDATSIVSTPNPYTTTGALRSGLSIGVHDVGFCWENSMEGPNDPNAWRCMTTTSHIMDPCFSAPKPAPRESVACLAAPWARSVTVLKLSEALPAFSPDKYYSSAALWAIQLANGARCIKGTGAMGNVHGVDIGYICTNGGDTTLPNNEHRVWTVEYTSGSSATATIVQGVRVVRAWRD